MDILTNNLGVVDSTAPNSEIKALEKKIRAEIHNVEKEMIVNNYFGDSKIGISYKGIISGYRKVLNMIKEMNAV